MTPDFVIQFFYDALNTGLLLAAPMLIAGLLAGVLISVFQAATQINEMTLVFIPKILAVGIALLLFFPWMLQTFITYTQNIFMNLSSFIR